MFALCIRYVPERYGIDRVPDLSGGVQVNISNDDGAGLLRLEQLSTEENFGLHEPKLGQVMWNGWRAELSDVSQCVLHVVLAC